MTMTTITPTLRLLPTTLMLALGLVACTPNPGEGTSGSGTGGVNAERTGGTTGSGGGAAGSASGGGSGTASGGNVGNGAGGTAPGSSGGSAGAGSGGSAGSTGSSGGAGGGKGSGGSTGTTDAMSAMEAPPASSGGATDWGTCGGTSFKPGVSAMDFCMKYEQACMFAAGGGKTRYASMADCIAKYSALSDGPLGGKACVAWHLCIAATPSTAETFCPHAPEASAMSGPCKAAYL
jgi:hypothetical protein